MEAGDGGDGGGECVVWSSVVGVGDFPGFEVGDCLFDDPADLVDVAVGCLLAVGEGAVGESFCRCEQAASDVAFVGDYLGGVESGEDVVGVEGDDVVGRTGQRVRHPVEGAAEAGQELDVDTGGAVLAGVQLGSVGPGPAGQQGAVDHVGGAGRHVVQGWDEVGQHGREGNGHGADRPRHGRLRYAPGMGDVFLGAVRSQIDQRDDDPFPGGDHRRQSGNRCGFANLTRQGVYLCSGQSRDTLHVRRSSSRGFSVVTKFSLELDRRLVRRAGLYRSHAARISLKESILPEQARQQRMVRVSGVGIARQAVKHTPRVLVRCVSWECMRCQATARDTGERLHMQVLALVDRSGPDAI